MKQKKKKKKGEEGYRFVSNFMNRFVFLPFFFSKKTKQTGCIIMSLHSASLLTGKLTLDVCISKCVCMRARPCVRACRARMCVHSFMCLTTVDVCVRLCLYIRHIGGMDVSIPACMILCVFLFSGHIHETKLELFSVWLVCHVFSDFDSRKNFKTEQEREREGERERE